MNRNLKKSIVSILLVSVFIFSGCSNKESNEYKIAEESRKVEPLSGTLTVSTYYDAVIMNHAQDFMALHPNVKIEMEMPKMGEFS